ncbi:FkbM family methyltransferase [Lentibacter sp.]|uniref:FkbM family methyltransferase n=1 Tax=Lentibacter sp. TaxID=2024994 RepID=UPI003F69B4E3
MARLNRRIWLWLKDLQGKTREVFDVNGVTVTVPRDADGDLRYVLEKGRPYEASEAYLISKYMPVGTNVVELGGCMGVISAVIRNQIGPDARHIVVEARHDLAQLVTLNASRNASPDKVKVVEAAIDYSGAETVSFAVGRNAHVGRVSAEGGKSSVTVSATTLRAVAKPMGGEKFALVCDIEGAETDLVAKESDIFTQIDLAIIELHPHQYAAGQQAIDEMVATLASHGLQRVEQVENVVCFLRA